MDRELFKNLYSGTWVNNATEHEKRRLGRYEVDFCPFCKRDICAPERPFNLKVDNHLDRCVRINQ